MCGAESHVLLQKTTEVIIEYMVGQVAAGAQMLEVFDSWAGDLSTSIALLLQLLFPLPFAVCDNPYPLTTSLLWSGPDLFSRFGLPYLKKIATGVKQVSSYGEHFA